MRAFDAAGTDIPPRLAGGRSTRSLSLAIPEDITEQLARLAEHGYRRPRDQADYLLIHAVRVATSDAALSPVTSSERSSIGPSESAAQPGPLRLEPAADGVR